MSHVLRLVRVDYFAKSIYSCYYRRLLCPLLPLQLRYTSGMAENKQQPQGILEKVKNLALGIKPIFFKIVFTLRRRYARGQAEKGQEEGQTQQ